jgi:hypothetical protein
MKRDAGFSSSPERTILKKKDKTSRLQMEIHALREKICSLEDELDAELRKVQSRERRSPTLRHDSKERIPTLNCCTPAQSITKPGRILWPEDMLFRR